MTQREAKRRVCGAMAATLSADLAGAGYIYEDDLSEEDVERMQQAAEELADEMFRRSGP